MEAKVYHAIKARDLLSPGDRLVVAVSGGPDSVALLGCLVALSARWSWEISIGHVNHGLRGMESEDDAAFVEQLGKHFNIPVSIREARVTKQEAKLSNQSLQAYAREIRYQAFEDILQERGATKIATGHTADDQAETVLMWMLRGSGTAGMSGIPAKRGARFVRPLLEISRNEILDYLKERQLTYRNDSSNSQSVYLRNRLRKDLIPQLKGYAPGIVQVLSRQAEIIREDHDYLEQVAAEAFQQMCVTQDAREIQLDRTALLSLPLAIRRRVVRWGLQQMSGNWQSPRFDTIQQLLNRLEHGQSGWTMHINAVDVDQEYDRLVLSKRETSPSCDLHALPSSGIEVDIPGEVIWPLTGQRLTLSAKHAPGIARQPNSLEMHLDSDTFTPELRIRSWRPGDVFRPKGMGGRQKKLQDFFSDIKLPRSQRAKVPLLVSQEGILWVGGLREDERFQVSPVTRSVVIATMTG
jgi:tRNA(Ile)-lysidine synthase